MIYRLTVSDLFKVCNENKYFILRDKYGDKYAINGKAALIGYKRKNRNPKAKTIFISFEPCDFNTYISLKEPFI